MKLEQKIKQEADTLLNDALMLEEIGCFSVLLEKIPNTLSKQVSSKLTVPIIGIGAEVMLMDRFLFCKICLE
jgi:Ketopantoate hydroxymethyltransferase